MNLIQTMRPFFICGLFFWQALVFAAPAAVVDVESLREKAKSGDLNAKVELAHLSLITQQGVEYDAEMIFETFAAGAKADLSRAHYGLAKCYVMGVNVDPDQNLALKHAKTSAEMNDPEGIRYLGNCYLYGRGMEEPDVEKGVELLKKSINMGNVMAEFTYAFYLTRNCKDRESNKEGLKLVKSLIERKHPDGTHLMGTLYHNGQGGLDKSRELAMKHYRMSADLNNAEGYHQVGNMLLQDGKPQEAIGWLIKAINRGSHSACWTLSKILKEDPELQEEENQWVGYAETAAIRGNRWAQDAVSGYYYHEADDDKKDWVKAVEFAVMAAKQGRCHCWDRLAIIYVYGWHGVKQDFDKALEYCRNHFQHGHNSSLYLGFALRDSKKFNKDKETRIKCYAAFLSAEMRGFKHPEGFMEKTAKRLELSEEDLAEAETLSKSGFPKPGCKILPED